MTIRRLSPKTHYQYIRHVKKFADFLGRSADRLVLLVATASGGLARADILPCAQFTHEGVPQPVAHGDRRGLGRLEWINRP